MQCRFLIEVTVMLSKVNPDTVIFDYDLYETDCPDKIDQPFGEILSQSLTTNYDLLKNYFKGIFKNCAVNDIDTSKVEGWDRPDFPKDKVFDENCTLEDLQRIKLTGSVPTNPLDPKVQNALNFVKQNGISILISPEAIERMNRDEDFYNKIMTDLSKNLYPGVLDDMRESITYQWGDITYESTTTDACIIATVSADGEVEYQRVSYGGVQRVNEDAPSYYAVIAKQTEKRETKEAAAEQSAELFLNNIYNMRGNLDLQMGESVSLMGRKKNIK